MIIYIGEEEGDKVFENFEKCLMLMMMPDRHPEL